MGQRRRRQKYKAGKAVDIYENSIMHGSCERVLPRLRDKSINLVVTSPPYANQRAKLYPSIPELIYPQWAVMWMEALRPKLADDGSVLLNIRAHLKRGVLSDYVMRTVLAIREAGWFHNETLVWHKPDAPPLASNKRPRRTYEEVYWFSRCREPYADLRACGNTSDRCNGWGGARRKTAIDQKWGVIHGGQRKHGGKSGTARITDVITAYVGDIGRYDAGVEHPAMYPRTLADKMIRTYSRPGDLVVDPFNGSGQTTLAAMLAGRRYIGIDAVEKYVEIARQRHGDVALKKTG